MCGSKSPVKMAIGSADVVISDMAPNMSGMAAVDIPTALGLVELALDMAQQVRKPGGLFGSYGGGPVVVGRRIFGVW